MGVGQARTGEIQRPSGGFATSAIRAISNVSPPKRTLGKSALGGKRLLMAYPLRWSCLGTHDDADIVADRAPFLIVVDQD